MFEGQYKEAGDFPASDLTDMLPLVCNVDEGVLNANIARTIARGTRLIEAREPHSFVAVLVGGGPSAEDDLDDIRARSMAGEEIFALNGAGLWLRLHGIHADAVIVLDARPHNAKFVTGLRRDTTLYLASQCHEAVFDAGRKHDIVAWHAPTRELMDAMDWTAAPPPPESELSERRPTVLIGAGTSVGMRALRLVHVLGYRTVHLYGYDSSYRDGQCHAYDQPENVEDRARGCYVGDRGFVSTPWMIRQADDFRLIAMGLMAEGMHIHVHGDGLLPEVARQMRRVE